MRTGTASMPSPLRAGGEDPLAELPATGGPLRLRRAWPRGRGHLLLEYVDPGGVSVPGQWFADPTRLAEVAAETALTAGPGKVVAVEERGVLLQRGGADRRLAALPGMVDDERATLVVHRPERRAVVRRRRPTGTTYVKVWRPGRAPAPSPSLPVPTPAVVAADTGVGVVEHAELPGRSLHELLGDPGVPDAEVSRAFAAAGAAVAALHGVPVPPSTPAHDAEAEAGVVARWLGHALDHGALPAGSREPAGAHLQRVRAMLADLAPARPGVLLHRDLHDKQVLVTPAGDAGMLDLDTLARGEAALDVANLLAHLELRVLQGRCPRSRAEGAAAAFVDAYRPGPAVTARLVAFAAASRLRLACVYAFRPSWAGVVPALLEGPQALLAV